MPPVSEYRRAQTKGRVHVCALCAVSALLVLGCGKQQDQTRAGKQAFSSRIVGKEVVAVTPVSTNRPSQAIDDEIRIEFLRQEAEAGAAAAQGELGARYLNGDGVTNSAFEGFKWLLRSAEQGYTEAECHIGSCYEFGIGTAKDVAEAVKWFRRAADNGNVYAQDALAVHYSHGEGVAKNESEALSWFRKAAEHGYAVAQLHLGVCYLQGDGAPTNYPEAHKWFSLAAGQAEEDEARGKQPGFWIALST